MRTPSLVDYVVSCAGDRHVHPWDTDSTIEDAELCMAEVARRGLVHDAENLIRLCVFPSRRTCDDGTERLLKATCGAMDEEAFQDFVLACPLIDLDKERIMCTMHDVLVAICATDKPAIVASINIREWYVCLWEKEHEGAGLDAYWSTRLRYRIAKKDWMRGWQDLRHALIGFPKDQAQALKEWRSWNGLWTPERIRRDRSMFCLKEALYHQLIQELFDAMCQNGTLNSDDPHPRLLHCSPGVLEATAIQNRGSKEQGMILHIAAWAQAKKVEKRERRIRNRMRPKT